jgi:hypothetical protein
VNSSRDLVVQSSRSPTGPFIGPEGQDPFWTTGIFRWDLFGSGVGVDITVAPELPETSDPEAVPFTTAYYFPGTDAPPARPHLDYPSTNGPSHNGAQILRVLASRTTMASQAPIGTPFFPRFTPTLPFGYHALNASIPATTQITSETPGGSTSSRHHLPGLISTLPPPPISKDLFHPLSEALILVAPSHLSHLIPRFLLVHNFTKEAKMNPLLQDKSQLGRNP